MERIVSMTNGNGEEYEIPAEHVESFRKTFPGATSTITYRTKDGSDYAIPEAHVDAFRQTFPDAQETRRMSMADGSTRDFTMPELSKYLRSKEYRESRDYTNKPEVGSPTWAAIKGGVVGAAQGAYYGAKSAAGKIVSAIPEAVASVEEAAGNVLSGGGSFKNAVGEWLVNNGRATKQWFDENIKSEVSEGLGYSDDLVKLGELAGDAAAMAVKFAPGAIAGPAYVEAIMAADGINAYRDAFDAAKEKGFGDVDANLAGAAAGVINYFGSKLLMGGGKVAAQMGGGPLKQFLVSGLVSSGAMGLQKGGGRVVSNYIEGRPLTENTGRDFVEGAVEGANFHIVNAVGHGGKEMLQARKEAAQFKEMRKENLLTVAGEEYGGQFLNRIIQNEGIEEAIKARKNGADVSRKLAQKADLPDNMNAQERNAVVDAIIRGREQTAAEAKVRPDGVQSKALDDTIAELVGEGEIANSVRDKVLDKIEDAKELDDPEKRKRLVGEAFEEWAKENPEEAKRQKTFPAEDAKYIESGTIIELPDGTQLARTSRGHSKWERVGAPENAIALADSVAEEMLKDGFRVVKEPPQPKKAEELPKAAEKPVENAEPPKTGNEPPKPAEGKETPSRASDEEYVPEAGRDDLKVQGTDYTVGKAKELLREDVAAKIAEAAEELGVDLKVKGVELHGSRVRGDAKKDSDLDLVVEYEGDAREDTLWEILNEKPTVFGGIKVDINPINAEKSGTLSEYMKRSAEYDAKKMAKPKPDGKGKMVKPSANSVKDKGNSDWNDKQEEKYSKFASTVADATVKYNSEDDVGEVSIGDKPTRLTISDWRFSGDSKDAVAAQYRYDETSGYEWQKFRDLADEWNKIDAKHTAEHYDGNNSVNFRSLKEAIAFEKWIEGKVNIAKPVPDGKGKMVKVEPKENTVETRGGFIEEIERDADKKVALNEEAGVSGENGQKEPLDEATKRELKEHYVFQAFEEGISDSGKLSSREGVGEVFDTFKNLVEKYNPPRDENGTVISQSVRRAAWMIESSAFATPEQKAFAHKYGEKYGTAADKPKPDGKGKIVKPAPTEGEKKETSPTRLESLAPTEDMPIKDEKAKFQKIEPITPEQEIEERVDLRRLDPKRRSDPKVLEWAKKHGRTITDGMVTPDAVREYDETMTEAAGRAVKRWFPDMKIVTHKYGEKIKRGVHVLEQKLVGTPEQRIRDKAERAVFRSEFAKMVADYEHSNGGASPKCGGVFTSDAYYLFDIINGEPLGIHRLKINDTNREKIIAFDKKYKSEIYKGARSSAEWARRFRDEYPELLQGNNGFENGEAGRSDGAMDVSLRADARGVSEPRGNDAAGEGQAVSVNYLRDTAGRTLGWFDPKSKEVHLLPGADPRTVAHEIMWHGTRDYMTDLAAKGDKRAQKFLDMMHDVEKNIPEELKKKVLSLYARGGTPVSQDTLMNEFGAWFTMEKGGKALEQAMKTAEGRNWFAKAFHTVKEMYKDFLSRHGGNRVDLSAVDGMTREEFVDWLAEQFASGKTLGNIKGEPKKVLSTEETKLQAYRRKAYDNNAAVRDLERDIEKKTGQKISADESVEAANALKYGLKEAANIEVQGKMAEFRKVLDENGIHYADLEYYAALKAAAGRDAKIDKRNIDKLTAVMKAAGASEREIADAVANYKSTNGSHIDPREVKMMLAEIENGADAAKYKKAYDELRKIIDETLVVQEQAGLVGKGDAAQWRAEEPDYVPFKNEYDAETGEWNGRGSSLNLTRPEHQMAKGRQSAAGDIIAHVFMDHQAAKHRAIENAVRQKLANLVRAHKELGKVEILDKDAIRNIEKDDPNVVVFKEGGRAYAIRLEGTRGTAIANAFTQRNLPKMGWADEGFSVFGKKVSFRNFARWSSGMATRYSPTFSIRNTTKDNIELANIVYSERGPIAGTKWMGDYIANRAKMAKTLAKYVTTGKIDAGTAEGAILDRYIKAGGLIAGGVQAEGVASIKAKLSPDAIAKEMRRGKSKTAAAAKHVLKSIEYLNEYAEMATRLGAFATEVKGGKSDAEAALFSRRVTVDFNRHGDYTPAFSVFRLFSNSTLGATARAAAALTKSKYGAAAAATMFANGLAQAFIEHEYNADEDKRRKLTGEATGKDVSEYDRKTALFYFRKGDKVYRIAQHESPFSLITYAGNCVGRWMCGEMDGKDVAKNLGVSEAELAYNFTPMGQINLTSSRGGFVNDFKAAIISGIVPSALQPIAEIAWNMDYKGDTIQRQLFNNADPRSYNGKDNSPEWSKFLAERMNDATGGNAGRQGWVDISPEVIQKLVEGYGKNAMRDISTAISVGGAIIKGELPKLDVRNKPVKRDFVRPLDGNDRRYNDALSAYKADVNELSRMEESWTDEEYNAYIDAHPWVKDRSTKKDIEEIGKLRKLERGYIFRNGKAVPHEWTEDELKEFKAERLERQARVLQDMGL